jgi:hypothetical protein
VSAIAHVLEKAGIPTTGISLIRPHSEKMNAPRALWTTFELGRPFGTPENEDFQRDVLRTALELLERTDGPILEDYPRDAPVGTSTDDDMQEGWACPVSFEIPSTDDRSEVVRAAEAEFKGLEPWYQMALDRRGRTTVGVSGLDARDCFDLLAGYAASGELTVGGQARTPAEALRFAIEDLKAWYQEAATAQPGSPTAVELRNWFWKETALARLFADVRDRALDSDDPAVKTVGARQLVPSAVNHG